MKSKKALSVKKIFADEIKLGSNLIIAPESFLNESDDEVYNIILGTKVGWYNVSYYEVDYGEMYGTEIKGIEIAYKNMSDWDRKNLQFKEINTINVGSMLYLFDYTYVKKNVRDEEGNCPEEWEDKMYDLTRFDYNRPHGEANYCHICDDRGVAIYVKDGYAKFPVFAAEIGGKVVAVRVAFKENY